MAKLRLLKTGHGDLCLAEWEVNRPDTIPQARAAFDRERIGKLAFRLNGPGDQVPIPLNQPFDESAPEILLVPPIQGGSGVVERAVEMQKKHDAVTTDYLRSLSAILNKHQDICDVLDSDQYAEQKVASIRELNSEIGTILGNILPG